MIQIHKLRGMASALPLVLVIGAPAAASWHGLTAAGAGALGMTGAWSWLVPLVFDAGAAYAAVLTLRDTLEGDSPGVNRALVWAYALGSAGFNWWYAERTGGAATAIFFAAASVSAVILWDRTLRSIRRAQLRQRGAIAAPAPRFRLARWLVAPGETRRAWCTAVIEGITDPATAVHAVRKDVPPLPPGSGPDGGTPSASNPRSTAAVIRTAIAELPSGASPAQVAQHCESEHGRKVAPSYVADVIRRDAKDNTDPGPLRIAG